MLVINIVLFMILFLYSACVVSSRDDKEIEKINQEK